MRIKGQKFTIKDIDKSEDGRAEKVERFVKEWLVSLNLSPVITFQAGNFPPVTMNTIATLTNYLYVFLHMQLRSGERSWVIVTSRFMSEAYKKFVDFYRWSTCETVNSSYRNR